jgi:SAM-dependent methyltransferase
MFLQFSREIWKSLGMSADVRAKYLKGLFLELVPKFEPLLYLDVGAGLGYNSLAFGEGASEILAVDLRFPENNVLRNVDKVHMVVADACFLPFRDGLFDVVSLFSVIEHVLDQRRSLEDVMRVLKPGGYLVVHVPNRFFPIELHSGLPFVFFVPFRVRGAIFKRFGHEGLGRINIPSVKKLKKMVFQIALGSKIRVRKVVYPSVVVWLKLRLFYKIALKTGVLNTLPLGYLLIVKKGSQTL